MSLFKKIKSAFVIEDDKADQPSDTNTQPQPPKEQVSDAAQMTTEDLQKAYKTPDGKINQKFTKYSDKSNGDSKSRGVRLH